MSADLQWMMIRKNSCFLTKSLGKTLTREPNNLTGENSFKHNGLVNTKTVGVEPAGDNGVVITLKRGPGAQNKPQKLHVSSNIKKGSRHTIKAVRNTLQGGCYRQDLTMDAVRRVSAISRSQNAKYGGSVKKGRSRRRKN